MLNQTFNPIILGERLMEGGGSPILEAGTGENLVPALAGGEEGQLVPEL